jgi:hypothetical protein
VKFLYPLLAALLAIFAIAPLAYPGAFQSHTGLIAYYNLIDLDQQRAQFFAWSPVIVQPFDVLRTEGALPYLTAEIFHLIGFNFLDAIKIVYALAWLASAIAMYALARQFVSDAGALLASIVYVYLPFHIATVYVRGAFAEAVAWALFPLVLLALIRQQTAYCLLFTVLLFFTQPGIALLFSIAALLIALALRTNWRIGLQSIVSGLAIGVILYVPALGHYGAAISADRFTANFVFPFQLFSPQFGFGLSTGNYRDQFPFQLGVVPLGLAIIAAALAWRANANNHRRTLAILLGAVIVITLLTFSIAAPVWWVLGIFVSYPWQILAFAGLALALIAGLVIDLDTRFAAPAMLAFLVALPIVASYNYLAPRFLDANPSRPAIAIFGDNEIALWDYRIVGPLRHGATLRLQLTWQALHPIKNDYTIFVRAVNEDGKTYGEENAKPQNNTLPTPTWVPGDVIFDTHTIQIDVEGPPEGYHLEFGLSDAASGQRVLTRTGVDHISVPRPGDPAPIISEQLPPR